MTEFISPERLLPSSGHDLETGPDGRRRWRASGHHGWFLYGPYLSVSDGIYRIKVIAEVEGPPDAYSYVEVIDVFNDGRIYAAHMYHQDCEVFVRLYESSRLEIRFRTEGESVSVYGIEIEALHVFDDPADIQTARELVSRVVAERGEPAAVFAGLRLLSDVGAAEEAATIEKRYLSDRTERTREPEVWSRLLALHGKVADLPTTWDGAEISLADARNVISQLTFRVVNPLNSTPELRKELRSLGYQAHHLQATWHHHEPGEPSRAWRWGSEEAGLSRRPPPLFERPMDIDRGYQTAMTRGEGFPAYCPVSGKLFRSRHAFLIVFEAKPFIFYRFEGVETFYVCTGANSDARLFVYMPRTQTIAWITDPRFMGQNPPALVRALNAQMVANIDLVAAYCRRKTKPAAVIGNDNYGHYFWLDISGLQYVVENGLHRSLTGLVKTQQQFAEPEVIFPELSSLHIHDAPTQREAFQLCLREGYLPIHFADFAVSDALAQRLRSLARVHASDAGRPPPDAPRPLLWLNLRAHNKVWASQVEGYAEILNALARDYGQVSALLDGVPDCAEIAAGVATRCAPDVTLYDGLEFSLWDKMNWAMGADGYICVIGTGLIICHSLAGAQGVAHGNREHMTQLNFWHTIQTGSPRPLAPRMEDITDSGTELQRDYDVDWRILLELIRQHLRESYGPPKPAPAAPAGLAETARRVWRGLTRPV